MKSICLVSGSSPEFLGGISLYQRNLIEYSKKNNLDFRFTWIYPGKENKEFILNEIRCIELKSIKYPFLEEFDFARKVRKIISKKNFDIINTHANWGYFLKNYNKRENQKIIHTCHGVSYQYFKVQFSRFGFFRYLLYTLLPLIYLLEKPPMKKADKIICVAEKVKEDLEKIYWKRKNLKVIRTGVDIKNFKSISKGKSRKELNLDKNKIYGLYSGRGGYFNKGLDRAVNLGKELYILNKNFRLIVIGSDKIKCKEYLDEPFIIYRGIIDRNILNKYYSASDFFFSLSRYEGGAPTLAVGEAMASECLVVCSKDSKPEIIENDANGLIIENFDKNDANKIIRVLNDKKNKSEIIKNSIKTIKELSLEKWGEKYFEILMD
ncbi:MAG: glycosyltransferase family 4 protein [Candidatus Diapherotrites archaeon]